MGQTEEDGLHAPLIDKEEQIRNHVDEARQDWRGRLTISTGEEALSRPELEEQEFLSPKGSRSKKQEHENVVANGTVDHAEEFILDLETGSGWDADSRCGRVVLGPQSVGPLIESLDYEINESQIYKEHQEKRGETYRWQYVALKWTFALLIGVGTGLTAFAINLAVENLAGAKFMWTFHYMREGRYWLSFGTYTLWNVCLVLFSSLLCAYVAPTAAGSGIPEVKSYLNGNDIPSILTLKTLIVKVLGSIGSVAGGLAVGKEGPLVHTGSCIASVLGQGGSRKYGITWRWIRLFRNDRDRRDLVTCGAAAGVAAAFRAPVGGVLFALEEAATWFSSHLLWRVFFTTAIVAVVVKTAMSWCSKPEACGLFGSGGWIIFDSGSKSDTSYMLFELLPAAALGIIGGLMGSLFNSLNMRITRWRRAVLGPRPRYIQVLEAVFAALLTSSVGYGMSMLGRCQPCPDPLLRMDAPPCPRLKGNAGNFVNFHCHTTDTEYNPLATLFLSTNDDAIRNLFSAHTSFEFSPRSLILFFFSFYALAVFTYGVAVPSGLFVPAILSGATYGRLMGVLLGRLYGPEYVDEGRYALIGAASFLGGSMRMTVSLTVILLELTNQLSLLPLVMLTLLISKSVGDKFNRGIYEQHVNIKRIPFIQEKPEYYMRRLKAVDAAAKKLVCLARIERVGRILEVLRTTCHNTFPVLDEPLTEGGEPVFKGLMLRHYLLVLLKQKKDFQRHRKLRKEDSTLGHQGHMEHKLVEFGKPASGKGITLADISLTEDELAKWIDLLPFLNPTPYCVPSNMSLTKVYNLFRQLGRRHLAVIPAPTKIMGIITRKDLLPERLEKLFPEVCQQPKHASPHKGTRGFRGFPSRDSLNCLQ